MEEDVTVADESNCDAILSAAPKIQELFGVRVERVSRLDCVDGGVLFKTSDVSGPSSSLRSSDGPTPPDQQKGSDAVSGVMIYPVAGDGVTLDSVNRAKVCTLVNTNCVLVSHAVEKGARLQVYMRCLTCDDSLRHVHTTQYDTDVYAALQHNSGAIERQTQAVVACDDNTQTVTISGLYDNVTMAVALTNRMLLEASQPRHVTLGPSTNTDGIGNHTGSATCLSAVPRHQGLCRTVSGNNNSLPKSQSDSAMCRKRALCRTRTLQEELSTAAYADKIEFALKLGYTEVQLRSVLEKLGWHVGKNELLSELVQLGSLEKSDNESDEHGDLNRSGQSESEVDFGGCNLDLTGNSDDCSEAAEGNNLRPIVIDGSNVAMSHGSKKVFSCYGIKLAVDWFRKRGHTEITVFVPQWRKETSRPDTLITDQEILYELEKEKVLVFTPARRVSGKRIVCYDDRYIIKLATDNDGVVVSNDNYRDLINEAVEYKKVIEERLLMYSFVSDRFMPPEDPLGRHGPSLDNFLRMLPLLPEPLPPTCPYGKKCTYGNKCRYYHPERGLQPHRSVVEKLAERADKNRLAARTHPAASPTNSLTGVSGQNPVSTKTPVKRALTKTRSLVTGGCVSKTPLGARNSVCVSSISRDVRSDTSSTQVMKTSPDDLDMSQMKLSVMVSQGDVVDSTLCHVTDQPTVVTQEDPTMTSCDRCVPGMPAVSACGGGGVWGENSLHPSELWACSPRVLLPSHSEPSHLHLGGVGGGGGGGGHLSLARKLSDESRMSLQREPSLKGADDLRSLSADGSTKQQPKADWFNEANDAEKWFVSNSARSSPQPEGQMVSGAASTVETSGANFRRRKSCGRTHQYDLLQQFRNEHSPLKHNLSAPVTTATTLPFPRSSGATMQRQSSTSDPLLHAKDDGAYVLMPTEAPPGGCVVTSSPVSWSFSTEKQFQHRAPVYRAAPPSVTSLGPNRQIKVAFTPMVRQPFPAGQRLVETQPPMVHMGGGTMMDAFVSRSPSHMIPVDVSTMSRQQAEMLRSYGGVQSHVHVVDPGAMNAPARQLIPNLSQPPPAYQGAPPVADVSEKRRNLYFHLCGLFPEDRVIEVMQQHPTETSPQVLCTYLIRMSYV